MRSLPESSDREAIEILAEAKTEIPKGTIFCNARDVAAVKAIIAEHKGSPGFSVGVLVNIDGGIVVEGEGGALQIDYSYPHSLQRYGNPGNSKMRLTSCSGKGSAYGCNHISTVYLRVCTRIRIRKAKLLPKEE